MENSAILPTHSTFMERAFVTAFRAELDEIKLFNFMDVDSVPERYLPELAAFFSVDVWDNNWTVETKRSVIKASFMVHRRKGTRGALRDALIAAGYGNATIVEGRDAALYDGSVLHDGSREYGEWLHWATFQIFLTRPISRVKAEQLYKWVEAVSPAHAHLLEINFEAVAHSYDGTIDYDGEYTHGGVS